MGVPRRSSLCWRHKQDEPWAAWVYIEVCESPQLDAPQVYHTEMRGVTNCQAYSRQSAKQSPRRAGDAEWPGWRPSARPCVTTSDLARAISSGRSGCYMLREARAYLSDIIDACNAIAAAVAEIDCEA